MFNLKKESKMKNLKVMTMTLIMCLMTIVSFGQITYSYENDVLTTTQETGTRVEKDMIFSLTQKNYESIKNSELFIKWEERTFSNPANEGYINKHKDWDRVILYINSQIRMSLFYVKMKLKNGNSLDFIDGSKGMIYLNEKGEIKISYNFKAQNGYGNFITSQCIYSITLKDGEEKTDCYIY
jgi:hypothetical protein